MLMCGFSKKMVTFAVHFGLNGNRMGDENPDEY